MFLVGGAVCSSIAMMVMPASRPPAPPRRRPGIDLVELTRRLWVGAGSARMVSMALAPYACAGGVRGAGMAVVDEAEGISVVVVGAGAGGGAGLVGAGRSVLDGDVTRDEVNDGHGDEEGRDFTGAAVEQVDVLAIDDVEAADAG